MADISTTAPIPTGPMIPQQYQDQIDQARWKQQIAQMLMQQSMANKGPQQIGPVAARTSPFAALANIAQAGVGGVLNANAISDASQAKQQYQTDQHNELQGIYNLPGNQQPRAAQLSLDPQIQAIGLKLQEQDEKRRELLAKESAAGGDFNTAAGYLSGKIDYNNPPPMQPYKPAEYFTIPDVKNPTGPPIQMVRQFDKMGRPTETTVGGNQVNVNLGNKEGELQTTNAIEDLRNQQTQARAAQAELATNAQVIQSLQQGAVTGAGADAKQELRKIITNIFGVPADQLPETGPTEMAKTTILNNLAERAKVFGAKTSNMEANIVKELVGTINTDPTALPQILGMISGKAMKTLQDYGTMLDIKRAGPGAKQYPGLYDTADVGINTPDLQGPPQYTLSALNHLQQLGGDVSKFQMMQPNMGKGETGSSVQPFAKGSSFTIQPSAIKPTIGNAAPPAAPVVAPSAKPTAVGPNGERLILSDDGKSWEPVK